MSDKDKNKGTMKPGTPTAKPGMSPAKPGTPPAKGPATQPKKK